MEFEGIKLDHGFLKAYSGELDIEIKAKQRKECLIAVD
jgi:hypothetical protein